MAYLDIFSLIVVCLGDFFHSFYFCAVINQIKTEENE